LFGRHELRIVVTFPLTLVTVSGKRRTISLIRRTLSAEGTPGGGASAVPARGPIQSAPGRPGHLPRRYYGRCVRCCHWTGTGEWRVTPAGPASQEARPGAEPLGPASLWREPRWNADRRAHPAGCAAAPVKRCGGWFSALVGVPPPFSSLRAKRSNPVRRSGSVSQRNQVCGPALDCFVASAPRNDGYDPDAHASRERDRMSSFSGPSRFRGDDADASRCRLGRLPARFLLVLRRASARLERRRTGT
jgi:hypothetical protein